MQVIANWEQERLEATHTHTHTYTTLIEFLSKISFTFPSPCTVLPSFLQVLERLIFLNLSHNRLSTLQGLLAFLALSSLNLSYNLVAAYSDLELLTQLQRLDTLSFVGKNAQIWHIF